MNGAKSLLRWTLPQDRPNQDVVDMIQEHRPGVQCEAKYQPRRPVDSMECQ